MRRRDRLAREQGLRPKNWPSSCYPLTFHSIEEDIPEHYRSFVTRMYYLVLRECPCARRRRG